MGITARHIFPPNTVIFEMYKCSDRIFENETTISQTYSSQTVGLNKLNVTNKIHSVFNNLIQSPTVSSQELSFPMFYDCLDHGLLPDSLNKTNNMTNGIQTSLANSLTGQYMIGHIAVGIYLMESTGSGEDWWAAAEQITFNEIVEGLDWLAEEANQRGVKVVWVYAPVEKISTSYEPINNEHVPRLETLNWIFDWVDDIFSAHSLTDEWDGAYALANQLRKTYKTNWAVEFAVVMDENDTDNMFNDLRFAYVTSPGTSSKDRGPLVVMTYNNDGWGPSNMSKVTAHEVGHIFGASDEYTISNCNCGVNKSYLQTVNGNCEICNATPDICIMNNNITEMCDFTAHEIGWLDTDGDKVMDPIDPNTGLFAWIDPVASGDLLQIYTLGGLYTNTISVTDDMLVGTNLDVILWDGSTYDNLNASFGIYNISKNGGSEWTEFLNFSGASTPTISNHTYNLETISYKNDNPRYVRHTIYDSLGSIYSRPQFDLMKNSQTTIITDISGYPDGIYTSKVFSWAPYGSTSNTSTIQFINYICGDINNSGDVLIDISDLNYLIDLMFNNGPAPVHLASADFDCNDGIDISDLVLMVAFMFQGGAPLDCCHSL